MKTQKLIVTLTAVALTTWLVGCKQETKTEPSAPGEATPKTNGVVAQTTAAVNQTVESVKAAGAKAVEDVKVAGTQAVAAVAEKAKEVTAPATAKAQELIDSAKSLFTEGKFADALATLNQTAGAAMSPEQQATVASLKAQIEQALAATSKAATDASKAATDAVNSFLKK